MKYKLLQIIICLFLSSVLFGQEMEDYTGQVFPLNHVLNTRIDHLPVHPNSANIVAHIGNDNNLHPDFGTEWEEEGIVYMIGMQYNIVGSNQPLVPIDFDNTEESDAGPWPIPANPLIETVFDWKDETDGDRHMLIVDKDAEMLYESWYTFGNAGGTAWEAGSGAIFDLTSNELRPETWTSSDAAGLPVFPLLIRYDEVERALASGGEIPHAIRFTANSTKHEYIWPARHYASSLTDDDLPAMGMRFRLKADFDISGFTPRVQVILRTFKKYGLIMSDNGSDWYIQGTHDDRWDDEEIGDLKRIAGRNFEVVDISSWLNHSEFDINSAAVPGDVVSVDQINTKNNHLTIQNYPNPVSGISTITYTLQVNSRVQLTIKDITGVTLHCISDEYHQAGTHTVKFDATVLEEGIFFCMLKTSEEQLVSRMVVIR